MRAAILNAGKAKLRFIEKEGLIGPIDWGLHCHLELYKSYERGIFSPRNALSFGIGPLAGSAIPGTNRLVFFSRSPIWGSLLNSSMGGAGRAMDFCGINFLAIEGRAKQYAVFGLFEERGDIEIKAIELEREELEDIYFEGYHGKSGIWALQLFALDEFKEFMKDGCYRILTAGPASLYTALGAIESTYLKDSKLCFGQDDWAGRGGMGSLMLQAHGVAAIAIGGKRSHAEFKEDLKSMAVVDKIFKEIFGKKAIDIWKKATEKYRYVPSLRTGGTFGVNMKQSFVWLPSFNWSSIYLSFEERKKIHELVMKHYLKEFNREVIRTKSWKHCGEACVGLCKKIHVNKKIDYEPHNAIGPNCGIFDLKYAEEVVDYADTLGFDAIEFGNIASFLLEALDKGIIPLRFLKEEIKPIFDPIEFLKDPVTNSHVHARILMLLARQIVCAQGLGKFLGRGIKLGAMSLSKRFKGVEELAVYIANGEFSIAPVQYWVPGVFVPLPIQGKYLTFYGRELLKPEELAEKCYERMKNELVIENLGICRFHREWAEKAAGRLLKASLGREIDVEERAKEQIRQIVSYWKRVGGPTPFETKRVKDIIERFYEEFSKQVGVELKVDAGEFWKAFSERFEELSLANS